MEVRFTSDQKAFARRAVECGRLRSEEAAVLEAIALTFPRGVELPNCAEYGHAPNGPWGRLFSE